MSLYRGDYYRRLQVPSTASPMAIKAAFRKLARQVHPQLHPHRPELVEQFHALREAYEVLSDRIQRQHYDRCQCEQRSGEAIPNIRHSAPTNPQTSVDFYLCGVHSALSQSYQQAHTEFSQVIERDPECAEAYHRRAEVRYILRDDPGVLADCQRAIAIKDNEAKTHYLQGLARYRLGYVESAIAAFDQAINHDPDEARFYARRGHARIDLKEISDGKRDLKRAAKLYKYQGDLRHYQHIVSRLAKVNAATGHWPQPFWLRMQNAFTRTSQPVQVTPHTTETLLPLSLFEPRARSPRASSRGPSFSLVSPQRSAPSKLSGIVGKPAGMNGRSHYLRLPYNRTWTSGPVNILRLLSNPGGEMASLYRRLSARQASRVGCGLAAISNLCLVLGGTQILSTRSWLIASWLWVAGGTTVFFLLLLLNVLRRLMRISGLWAADVFMLGTTLIPLGILIVAAAYIPRLFAPLNSPTATILTYSALGIAAIWSLSHSVISLHSGLIQLHRFPARTAGWLTPVLLGVGLMAGILTWTGLVLLS